MMKMNTPVMVVEEEATGEEVVVDVVVPEVVQVNPDITKDQFILTTWVVHEDTMMDLCPEEMIMVMVIHQWEATMMISLWVR